MSLKLNGLSNGDNILVSHAFKEQKIGELIKWRNDRMVTIRWQFYGNGQVKQDGNIHFVNLTTFMTKILIFL